jgi:hypothetical protein
MKATQFALFLLGITFLFIQNSRAQALQDAPKLVLFIAGKPIVADSITLSTILQADSLSTNKSWIRLEKATITFYGPGVCVDGQGLYEISLPKGKITTEAKKMMKMLKGNYNVSFESEKAVRIFGDDITVGMLTVKVLKD